MLGAGPVSGQIILVCLRIGSAFWSQVHTFGLRWTPDVGLHATTCKAKGKDLACRLFLSGGVVKVWNLTVVTIHQNEIYSNCQLKTEHVKHQQRKYTAEILCINAKLCASSHDVIWLMTSYLWLFVKSINNLFRQNESYLSIYLSSVIWIVVLQGDSKTNSLEPFVTKLSQPLPTWYISFTR